MGVCLHATCARNATHTNALYVFFFFLETSLLLEVLAQTFKGDVRGSLSSRVHLVSFRLAIFNMIDMGSQSMAAALSVKAASDLLVRFFLAMLDALDDQMSRCCYVLIRR